MSTLELAAILLAGGRATRLEGKNKPFLTVGGRTLFDIAHTAVLAAGAQEIYAVGAAPVPCDPPDKPAGAPALVWLREDPPFAGPAAAVMTAIAHPIAREWTIVLACDLPHAERAVSTLTRALPLLPSDSDGVCLGDPASRPQWLTGIYRTAALARAAAAVPDSGRNAPVRALLDDLALTVLAVDHSAAESTRDIDTWQDLIDARHRAGRDDNDAVIDTSLLDRNIHSNTQPKAEGDHA